MFVRSISMGSTEIRQRLYFAQRGQGVLLSSESLDGSKILGCFREEIASNYLNRHFSIQYNPEIDSEQKLTEGLINATELGLESEKVEKRERLKIGISDFFEIFVEKYDYPFLLVEGLDKILFYGSEVHKRLDVEEYRRTLTDVQERRISQEVLFKFHKVYCGLPNPVIRSYCIHRGYSLIGTATTGTIEHDFVFRNVRSPIWGNLAELHYTNEP